MKLTFLGAAGEVTGSSILVDAGGARFLVDCGMFQGRSARGTPTAAARNRAAYARALPDLDFVLLTHAHIDHCGLLPRFAAAPARLHVYCTRATADLVPVMLKDSAHVQQRNHDHPRRSARDADAAPLYDAVAVDRLAQRLVGVPVDVPFEPAPGVQVRWRAAGHIVGAAFAEVTFTERGKARRAIFSGDLGEDSPLIVRARANPSAADVVVVESTYGDRNHRPRTDTEDELVQLLDEVLHRRHGNVIVPAFALGRAQEFLLLLYRLAKAGRIRVPLVFVDSPLAAQAAAVTFSHLDALDPLAAEFRAAERAHKLPFALRYTENVEDSMMLNAVQQGAVIVAASGMCEAGRIRHHLRHNLPRRECAIVFTGFQAAGTLGRRLVDGARAVPLFGESVPVRASVHTLGGLSAHAGQDALMHWLSALPARPRHLLINHGEPQASQALAARIARDLGWSAEIAAPDRADVC